MKRTISIMIAVAIMIFMFVVPASAEVETSPMVAFSLAEYTAPVEITAVSEIAEGESILKNDIEGDITITSGEYVIDLNGYTWVGRLLIEGGNVTVKDTSAEKTGKIDASLRADAIDVSGGAIVSLEDITVIGAFGTGDGLFVTGSPNVTIKNCVLTAGKAGIDVVSLSAVVIVEDTLFADFSNIVPEKQKDDRNAAIEFRNNAKVVLRGDNEFEQNTIICRTATHELSFEESFILGDNVEVTFTEDVDMGVYSEYAYKSTTISYVFDAPTDAPADNTTDNNDAEENTDNSTDAPADNTTENNDTEENTDNSTDVPTEKPNEESKNETVDENKPTTLNPNTGNYMPFVIVVAAIALVVTVLNKKRAF